MILSIQYLRAFAVLGVVFAHTRGGYFMSAAGVDIFFVISGYIMMHLLSVKKRNTKDFVLARFLRIAPLYYIFSILVILLGFANNPTIMHTILSFTFLKTPMFTSPVLSVGWTLEYEFIFYMMVAFSLLFTKKLKYNFLITSLLIVIAFIGIDIILYPQKMYGLFIEFWYGMAIFFLIRNKSILEFFSINKIVILFIFGFLFYSFTGTDLYLDQNGKTFLRFISFGLPSAIIVFSMLLYEKKYKIFKSSFLLLLGNASFAIYLSHSITLHLYYAISGYSRYESFISDMFSIILAIVIGIIIHIYIEKYIIKYNHILLKRL